MSYKYWVAFSKIEEIGAVFINKLYSHFNSIEHAWTASPAEITEIEGITKKQLEAFVTQRQNINPEKELDYVYSNGIKILTFEDEEYPELLKQISNPPMTLFYKGDLSRCNFNRTLSVVGSRRASQSAKEILAKLLDDFYGTDICFVSGGALGIDTVAHESAIRNNLSTISVIGSGLNKIYPTQNKDLFKKIEDNNGIIMSEYWCEDEPLPWRFPIRNRIVSGLSNGTLIAEAALKSGALITANLCLEQNRELMCMPGSLSNPNTQGIYKLLKQGATLVTNIDDILETLNWEIQKQEDKPQNNNNNINLDENEKIIFDLISLDDLSTQELLNKTNLNISDLMITLTTLELKGMIKQIEGEKYSSIVKC